MACVSLCKRIQTASVSWSFSNGQSGALIEIFSFCLANRSFLVNKWAVSIQRRGCEAHQGVVDYRNARIGRRPSMDVPVTLETRCARAGDGLRAPLLMSASYNAFST